MSTFSVITPTLGRESLKNTLDSVLPQLVEGDEMIVIGDGPRPRAKELCDAVKSKFVTYYEVPFTGNYGNPGRNDAIAKAKASHLFFIDDDDVAKPNAFAAMRKAADANPGRPLVFKMNHQAVGLIYKVARIKAGDISGQMFVTPNVPGKIGKWSGKYEADFDFVMSTLAFYPGGVQAPLFLPEITVNQGNAGRTGVELP